MAKFKPYFCPGCGVMVTREPWPHLDRSLFDPPHEDPGPRAAPAQPKEK